MLSSVWVPNGSTLRNPVPFSIRLSLHPCQVRQILFCDIHEGKGQRTFLVTSQILWCGAVSCGE
jgi:hypothetical protein